MNIIEVFRLFWVIADQFLPFLKFEGNIPPEIAAAHLLGRHVYLGQYSIIVIDFISIDIIKHKTWLKLYTITLYQLTSSVNVTIRMDMVI